MHQRTKGFLGSIFKQKRLIKLSLCCFTSSTLSLEQCYKLLQATEKTAKPDIQQNYYRLAKIYHPDVNKSPEASEIFSQIKQAYEAVMEDKERIYHSKINNLWDAKERFDQKREMYESLKEKYEQKKKMKEFIENNIISYTLKLDFLEAAFGCTKVLHLMRNYRCSNCKGTRIKLGTRKVECGKCKGEGIIKILIEQSLNQDNVTFEVGCDECEGEGTVIQEYCSHCNATGYEQRKVEEEIQIPKGVETGTVLKFKNKGHFSMIKGSGELWINIEASEDSRFKREGFNLYSNLNVNLIQAALGDRIEVDTISGKYKLQIPRGTNHGDKIIVDNFGIFNPYKFGKRRGDHIFTVSLDVPKQLNKELQGLMKYYSDIEKQSDKNYKPADIE